MFFLPLESWTVKNIEREAFKRDTQSAQSVWAGIFVNDEIAGSQKGKKIRARNYIIGSRNYCVHARNRVAGRNPKTTTDQ